MAFNPSSTIYLCNVPIDSTYKNQIYFATLTEQQKYFASKVKKHFTEYRTVRTVRADGSTQSTVRVECNIEVLQSLPCNYMYYRNANHGTKFFYAFITKFVYVNEEVTDIHFETDVYQTWLFDVSIKQSYVVREHSATDEIGDNVVQEKFNIQDFYSFNLGISNLEKWGYLIGSSESGYDFLNGGFIQSGIYQGLYFFYSEDASAVRSFIDEMQEEHDECIQFIAVIPKFTVSNAIYDNDVSSEEISDMMLAPSTEPAKETISIDFSARAYNFNGYNPKNNKLYTYPFSKLVVTNHSGDRAEYKLEDFYDRNNVEFNMYGDISANPSITLIPLDYQGIKENYDCGISINGFPQCSFTSDTFKLWLAKNQYAVGMDLATGIGNIAVGIATASSGVGALQAMSGVTGVANTINSVYQTSREPNKAHSGSTKNNLLTAIGKNRYDFYWEYIKKEHAETIDNFFTMYGYQTNKLKVPNVSARPYFNYVQTIDINIVGAIPNEDMERLKNVYNSGVTLWKSNATVGDYSVDNSPE